MAADWERYLARWESAALVDETAAQRIRAYETERSRTQGLHWPVLLALAFGSVLLGAGVLLFVSAHWENLAPSSRMSLVLLMVAVFHVGGAFAADRLEGLSSALHTVGTVSLGAGIALTGQIFNLAEHWPGAVLLWTVGAALGWAVLGHWPQGALTALLFPAWLSSEWYLAISERGFWDQRPLATGLCLLASTYLTARRSREDSPLRQALGWIGGLALIPSVLYVILASDARVFRPNPAVGELGVVGWAVAFTIPLAMALLLRQGAAWLNGVAAVWTLVLSLTEAGKALTYLWCALGAVGLIAWGLRDGRRERINLGVAGFAITVLAFYFSDVMDKLGRSASLIGLGLLLLAGGWALETARRRLIAQVGGGQP